MIADVADTVSRRARLENLGVATQLCGNHQMRFLSGDQGYSVATFHLGRCLIGRLSSAPITLAYPGGRRSGDLDGIKLAFSSGRSRFRQDSVTYMLPPNACLIYDPVKPYVFSYPGSDDQIYVHVPRTMMASRYGGILRRPQIFLPSESGLPTILRSLLDATCDGLDLLEETSRARLSTTVTQLAADLLETRLAKVAADSLSLDMLLYRIKAHVAANLDDATLSVAKIADSMGCSPRYVYRAFDTESVSPSEYIRNSRLELASRRLSVATASESLGELAFLSGFSCYAHFSRAFKAQFGLAPRDWRQSVLDRTPQLLLAQ